MLKCSFLFFLLCMGGCVESLLGSDDLDTWVRLADKHKNAKKYTKIEDFHWHDIGSELDRSLPGPWKHFHEAFQDRNPPAGQWGRIPSKSYVKLVWEPYQKANLLKDYFPIVFTGESFFVLDQDEQVRLVCNEEDNTFYDKIVAKTLFEWVSAGCPT